MRKVSGMNVHIVCPVQVQLEMITGTEYTSPGGNQ